MPRGEEFSFREKVISLGRLMPLILLMVFVLLALGCFVDPTTMILITTPIFRPVIVPLGSDPIWFGVVFIICLEMGYLTSPFGFNLFVIKSIAPNLTMTDVIFGTTPFVFVHFLVVLVLLAFSELALFLPRLRSHDFSIS